MKFEDYYIISSNNSCWIWKKSKTNLGYGKAFYDGKTISAHRLSYILHKGEIPVGLFILHSCDNPSCVNPEHLRAGTQSENIKEMHSKNRGYRQPHLKITDEMLKEIKESKLTQKQIALKYNVHQSTICKLKQRKNYAKI